jgi:integrase/recombinase XerD
LSCEEEERLVGVPRLCVDEAAEAVVDAYRNYELVERGLAELTVDSACYVVRQFLAWRAARGRPALAELDAAELGEYVGYQAGRLRIGGVRQTVVVLRTFCRFLFSTGVTEIDLAGAVPSVSGIRFDGLPKAVDRDVVGALLASCDLQRPVGLRDYAILLLMVRLGLRAVEIARMELGDIDWRAGEIMVRGKGGRRDRLPLPGDVGQALADYLVKGRQPGSCGSVFLAAAGEPVGMSRNAAAFVSRTASKRAGIAVVGGHRLRHTAATELLRGGASLREVGEVLRQSDRMTTSTYAKIDERQLHLAVRPWPAG